MFKVGDIVRIKSYDEIIEVNRKMGLSCPSNDIMLQYCGKTGKIMYVNKDGPRHCWIGINVSKSFLWRESEISPVVYDNFFPLRMWL